MCNCNQKRSTLRSEPSRSQPGMIQAQLIVEEPLIEYGNVTGRMYVFRNINDTNWVDKRDALSMQEIKSLQLMW
jgi:hypothetical protein